MSDKFIAGTYIGKAKGMKGQVVAKVTVDKQKITKISLNLDHESKQFGQAAKDKLIDEIMTAQSADVDAVTGASVTSWAVKDAVSDALDAAQGINRKVNLQLKDGTFTGVAEGHGGPLEVSVTTKDNKITNVKILKHTESPNVGDYVMKFIPAQIVKQQTLGVDAVSGATVTSNGILAAVRQAIKKAGGDLKSWKKQPYQKQVAPAKDLRIDVVIAGAGLAGLSTAAFALKKGLHVVLVEKNDQPGGSFRYAAGAFATMGSKALEKAKQTNQIDELINWLKQLSEHSKRPIDLDFVRYLAERSGKTFDDLLEMADAKPSFFLKLPYIAAGFAPGARITEVLQKFIADHGGTFLNDTVITKIKMQGERATGIEAENANGKFTIAAANVVIATGGASYKNEDLLAKVTPSTKNINIFNGANPGNTGDGYRILREIGAKFFDNDVYKNAELDFAPQMHTDYNNEPDYSKAIVVNAAGKRFTNEAPFSFLNLTTALYHDGSPKYYLIYDAAMMDPKFKARVDAVSQGGLLRQHLCFR